MGLVVAMAVESHGYLGQFGLQVTSRHCTKIEKHEIGLMEEPSHAIRYDAE